MNCNGLQFGICRVNGQALVNCANYWTASFCVVVKAINESYQLYILSWILSVNCYGNRARKCIHLYLALK